LNRTIKLFQFTYFMEICYKKATKFEDMQITGTLERRWYFMS